MKIVVFNVKFSENLGDGLLAECVESALSTGRDEIEVETVDLAGRQAFATGHGGRRRLMLGLLHRLPTGVRQRLVRAVLERRLRVLRRQWEEKVEAADAVVIGGGNLFQDDDLNFPLKIGAVLDCVLRHDRPLAVYAVGVGGHWSEPAYDLFARLKQTRLVHLSVRDGFAQDSWRDHFPEGPAAKIVRDPGLLLDVPQTNGSLCTPPGGRLTIGLCITDPIILQRHGAGQTDRIPFANINAYRELIELLLDDGQHVVLFCNGAREDQAFAERIRASVASRRVDTSGTLDISMRPEYPGELIRIIQSMDVILAHRLHACIAAYALAIPHVGLDWDRKVEGFFNSVARETYFIKGAPPPKHVALLLKAAQQEGIEMRRHRDIISEARAGISNMRRRLIEPDLSAIAKI